MIYQDISSLLESESLGTLGSDFFWGHMPDKPDSCIAIYEYPGAEPVYTKSGMQWERPRLQVIARARTYVEANQKAEAVYALLSGTRRKTLNGTLYDSIRARQRPFADPNGRDDQGRFRVFCNYAVKRAP